MQTNPFLGDVKKLAGGGERYRRRVGSWRILFRLQAGEVQIVDVVDIRRRTSTTY